MYIWHFFSSVWFVVYFLNNKLRSILTSDFVFVQGFFKTEVTVVYRQGSSLPAVQVTSLVGCARVSFNLLQMNGTPEGWES